MPRRIFWLMVFVTAGYFLYRWRQQQAQQSYTPPTFGSAEPPARPGAALSTGAAPTAPRRIPTRIHKGAPPAVPLASAVPPLAEPATNLGAIAPEQNDDPVMLSEQQPPLPAVPQHPELASPDSDPVAAPPASDAERTNINTADEAAFIALPGIGPSLARRIIEYRTANGPFATIEGLIDIRGIGYNNIDEFRHLIRV